MSGKGVVITVLVLVLIIAISTGIFLVKNKATLPDNVIMGDLAIECRDWFSNEPCETDFSLENSSGTIFLSGHLINGWNVYNGSIPMNIQYYLWGGFDDAHYISKAVLGNQAESYHATFRALPMAKDVIITHNGTIKDNNLLINITPVGGNFARMQLCLGWTYGILNAQLPQFVKKCEQGSWKNYSSYDAKEDIYTLLPQGDYLCGEELMQCEDTKGLYCYLTTMPIPDRLSYNADRCYNVGKTLVDGTSFETSIDIEILDSFHSSDKLHVFVLDKEYVKRGTNYRYMNTDNSGKDIAYPDIEYIIEE